MAKSATPQKKGEPCTREKILAAARQLFAEKGFEGTTTAAIARRAEVNEALIFRHFPGKMDLYSAILKDKLDEERLARVIRAAGCPSLTVEEALRLMATRFAETHDSLFLRLYYHSALEGHDLANVFYEQFVSRYISLVEGLIQRGVDNGLFRPVDPPSAARAFTGMLRSYVLTRELFPSHGVPVSDVELAATFCDIFLLGVVRRD